MTSSFLGSRTALPQAARPARSSCSRMVVRAAADSPVWLPGTDKPKQLEGLVGNFGFDPLQLGTDKERLEWCAGFSYSISMQNEWTLRQQSMHASCGASGAVPVTQPFDAASRHRSALQPIAAYRPGG